MVEPAVPASRSGDIRLPSAGWRRRPAGEPPPLPRGVGWRGWAWATGALLLVGVLLRTVIDPEEVEQALLRWFEDLRTPLLVDVANALDALTEPVVIWIIRVAVVLVAAFYKRWRHIVTFLALLIVVDFIVTLLNIDRPPPPGVTVLAPDADTTFPSLAVASLSVTLFGAVMVLVPAGPWRRRARAGVFVLIALVVLARMLLGAEYAYGRHLLTPARLADHRLRVRVLRPRGRVPRLVRARRQECPPGPRRRAREAIVQAVHDQLGFTVAEIEAVRPRRLGRLEPAADASRGGRRAPVRQDLLDEPPARRPLVQDRANDPVRTTRGRGAARLRPPARCCTRTTRSDCSTTSGSGVAKTYGVVELTPTASTCSSPSSSRTRRRSATPRSTTR